MSGHKATTSPEAGRLIVNCVYDKRPSPYKVCGSYTPLQGMFKKARTNNQAS